MSSIKRCLGRNHRSLTIFLIISALITESMGIGEVIWAVNSGGETHTDVHGIVYESDPLEQEKVGIASDYGKTLMIGRVNPQDQILYQTERYHMSNFGYEVPIKGGGDFVLVLKFCEVWFTSPGKKVFDVALNGEHTIVHELDIFSKVGRGVAHDEIIPFSIRSGKLKVNGETSTIIDNKISLDFIKGDADNPKVNAVFVMKGTIDDIPKLPPLPGAETQRDFDDEEEEIEELDQKPKKRKPSGPKVKDPYAADDTSSILLPVFVAVGAFFPLLFCLCKL